MASSAEQMRAWTGPAILSFGFRPFFLGGAIWAALAMVLWLEMLSGGIDLPIALAPVDWHAHEFLYGYLGAIAAGFLLTAVPNWTGRLPIVGRRLAVLVAFWLLGRVAMALSGLLPWIVVALADLSFIAALAVAIAREIAAGKNWRNLPVLGMLGLLLAGNAVFHAEAAADALAAQGYGLRMGLAAAMLMIALIGGRIIPSFTRNWLVKIGSDARPAPPMQRFDKLALLVLVMALATWVLAPERRETGVVLMLAGALHLVRLARWQGLRSWTEPLVLVLHAGYVFLPLGALALGLELTGAADIGVAAALHLWMAGAIGLMTLAVMTRATLGHTGRDLVAGPVTTLIYLSVVTAALARLAVGVWPGTGDWMQSLAGIGWIVGFGGFALVYGPMLCRGRAGS